MDVSGRRKGEPEGRRFGLYLWTATLLVSSGLAVGPGARGAASRRRIPRGRVTALGGCRVEGQKNREKSRARAAG